MAQIASNSTTSTSHETSGVVDLDSQSSPQTQSTTRRKLERIRSKLSELFFTTTPPTTSTSAVTTPTSPTTPAVLSPQQQQQQQQQQQTTPLARRTSSSGATLKQRKLSNNILSGDSSTLISSCYYGYTTHTDVADDYLTEASRKLVEQKPAGKKQTPHSRYHHTMSSSSKESSTSSFSSSMLVDEVAIDADVPVGVSCKQHQQQQQQQQPTQHSNQRTLSDSNSSAFYFSSADNAQPSRSNLFTQSQSSQPVSRQQSQQLDTVSPPSATPSLLFHMIDSTYDSSSMSTNNLDAVSNPVWYDYNNNNSKNNHHNNNSFFNNNSNDCFADSQSAHFGGCCSQDSRSPLNPFLNRAYTDLISFNADLSVLNTCFANSLHLIDEQDNFFDVNFMTNYISYVLMTKIGQCDLLRQASHTLRVNSSVDTDINSSIESNLLKRVARDIYLQSESEPCGLKGCKIAIYLETSSRLVNSGVIAPQDCLTPPATSVYLLEQFRFDASSSLTTFELSLVLKEAQTGATESAAAHNDSFSSSGCGNSGENISFATLTRRFLSRSNSKNNSGSKRDDKTTSAAAAASCCNVVSLDTDRFDILKCQLY